MGSRLYMYVVVRRIAKDVSHSSVCASLGGDQCQPLSTCIEFQRRERQPRPPTALQWGREEAVQFMQLTQASVWVFITYLLDHSWTLLSERRGFAGRCPSYINLCLICICLLIQVYCVCGSNNPGHRLM